jgi:alpha-D-ribose 1-methylphosphonate 5-triphosphate synthase subunit PhnG
VLALANSIANGAEFAAVAGRQEVAARLLGAAEGLRQRGGVTIDPFNLDDPDALITRVRAQLGEPAFAAAWAQGETLPLDQAIAEVDAVLAEAAHDDSGERQVAGGPTQ